MLLSVLFTEMELPVPDLPVFDLSTVVKAKKKHADDASCGFRDRKARPSADSEMLDLPSLEPRTLAQMIDENNKSGMATVTNVANSPRWPIEGVLCRS